MDIQTGIIERLDGYSPYFTIGAQTFYLSEKETEKEAEWLLGCLNSAFSRLQEKKIFIDKP